MGKQKDVKYILYKNLPNPPSYLYFCIHLQMREANLPASYLLPPTCLFCTTLLPLRSMSNKKMQRMLHFLLFILFT